MLMDVNRKVFYAYTEPHPRRTVPCGRQILDRLLVEIASSARSSAAAKTTAPIREHDNRKIRLRPFCANDWVRGICEKPRIKCAECPHRRFLPVTDDVIRWRLSGHDDAGQPFVAGVYPMLRDETCLFLAVDFDKREWPNDAAVFRDICRRLDLPAAAEPRRSGLSSSPCVAS